MRAPGDLCRATRVAGAVASDTLRTPRVCLMNMGPLEKVEKLVDIDQVPSLYCV